MKSRYKSAFLSISLLFISLINSSLAAGAKRMRNDEEASTSRQTNLDLPQQWIDGGSPLLPTNPPNYEYFDFFNPNQLSYYQQAALDVIAKVDFFETECSVVKLMNFVSDPPDAWAHVMECDAQAHLWLKGKVSRLGNSGKMIQNWLQLIKNYLDYPQIHRSMSNFDLMLEKDIRPVEPFSKRFRSSWQITKKDKDLDKLFDEETYNNARRAFYLGDGYCIHILTEPFDRVEKFVQVLLDRFQHLESVRNFKIPKKEPLIIVRIYLFRKMCRMYEEQPWVPKKIGLLYRHGSVEVNGNSSRLNQLLVENAKREFDKEYDCDWHTAYSRKIEYKLLKKVSGHQNYKFFKKSIDESIDELLRHCLPIMQLSLREDNLYKDSPKKHLLPALINQLSLAVSLYELPDDQSINSALEIWSDDNKFKRHLLDRIEQNIIDVPDKDLTSLYVELLQGSLSDLHSGVFKEPVFNDEGRIEQKALEFLSHIFSLVGYKPGKNISSFLLNYYYLYRISEISNVITMTAPKEPDETSVKRKKNQRNDIMKELRREKKEANVDYDNFNLTDAASLLNVLDKIASSDFKCTPDALEVFMNVDFEKEFGEFFNMCNHEIQMWLIKKESRLGNIKITMTRWINSIYNLMNHPDNNLNNLIISRDYRKNYHFQRRLRNTWRSDTRDHNGDASIQSKYAYYFGDGICVHMLAPPFNRIEKFVDAVLKDFSHLKFVEDLKRKEVYRPISIVIYVFQKLCHKFHQVHGNYDHEKSIKSHAPKHIYDFELLTIESILKKLDYQAANIYNFEKDFGRKCNWFEVFSRKQKYRLLYLLRDQKNIFEKAKMNIDASIDVFVEECLISFSNDSNLDQDIYSKVRSTPMEPLLGSLIHRLEILMSFYHLPYDQSINEALDMRSTGNEFKKIVVEDLNKLMFDLSFDNQLASLYIFLLRGNLSHLADGIFREPIYWNNLLVERYAIEFLFHVFSIRGYKPRVSHPLINLYYLYKIGEVSYMIAIKNPIINKP